MAGRVDRALEVGSRVGIVVWRHQHFDVLHELNLQLVVVGGELCWGRGSHGFAGHSAAFLLIQILLTVASGLSALLDRLFPPIAVGDVVEHLVDVALVFAALAGAGGAVNGCRPVVFLNNVGLSAVSGER